MLAPPTSKARTDGDQRGLRVTDHSLAARSVASRTPKANNQQDCCIVAELIGDNECRAAGLVVRSTTPVLAMCRKLVTAGIDPATPLECYRGTTLAITVASIAQGAGLEINGHGTGFRSFREGDAASLVRSGTPNQAAGTPLCTPRYDTRSRAFCGPTAMAAVTGEPISVLRDAIRQASGKPTKSNGGARPVMGVSNTNLVGAMRVLGWHVVEQWAEKPGVRYTLDAFAKDHGERGPFIVNVTGHYVAISQREFCDAATQLPCDLFGGVLDRKWFRQRKRKGSAWVRNWWRFEKRRPPPLPLRTHR